MKKPRITKAQLAELAKEFDLPLAALQAFIKVESRGAGFLPDGRPVILFERHIFYRESGKVPVSKSRPDLSDKTPGGYAKGPTALARSKGEWLRLEAAKQFHEAGALRSASWGAMQVMGFNAEKIGYKDVFAMVAAFTESEYNQIRGGLMYCKNTRGLMAAIRNLNWREAARLYNGEDYEKNNYHTKLDTEYNLYAKLG